MQWQQPMNQPIMQQQPMMGGQPPMRGRGQPPMRGRGQPPMRGRGQPMMGQPILADWIKKLKKCNPNNVTCKRLCKDYREFKAHPINQILAEPDPKDYLKWYFVFQNMKNSPYEGGIYLGQIIFPLGYPFCPPHILMITPNGRFKSGMPICTSFTAYQPEKWSSVQTVKKMLLSLLSFFHENVQTVGSISTSIKEKKRLAQQSHGFNMQNPNFVNLFQSKKV